MARVLKRPHRGSGMYFVTSGPARPDRLGMLSEVIRVAFTGGEMKRMISGLGLDHPANLTSMYLDHEPHEYMEAAVLAVNQRGA